MQSLAKSLDADLMVAGCQGTREDASMYLGTTAGGMMMASRIPVLLIPPRCKYSGIQHIAIAAIFIQVRDNLTIAPLQTLIEHYQPDVRLLLFGHVPEDEDTGQASLLSLTNEVDHIENDQYSEALSAYLNVNPADILVIVKRKKGFLEKTIGPKRTSANRFHASIPVLVLIGEND